MMEYLSLKPNREILNAKFDSYHLGTESLELKRLNLLESVAYYPLTEEHYSYSHLRAHAAQNLLTLDRWNENEDSLYFIDKTLSVMGLAYNKESETFGSPLKLCQFPAPPTEKIKEHISPSLSFPSSETCLFNDGAGKLYLVSTGRREAQLEKQNWICQQPTVVCEMKFPFYICNSATDIEENIHCTIMSLEDEKMSSSNHPEVTLQWMMFVQNKKESTSAGDQYVCHFTKTFSGMSVPNFVSQTPDYSGLIIASQGQFKMADDKANAENLNENSETTNGKKDEKNSQQTNQNEDKPVSNSLVVNEVERQSSAYTGEQIEECDMETEEDLKLSVLNKEDGSIQLQTQLSGHQWLFNVNHNPVEPLHFCIRHDVDGLLWKPVAAENKAKVSWKHVTTFNALGYIQASKKNHKFVTCSQTFGFVAILDCVRNIYIYITKSVADPQGTQYVLELPTSEEILGVRASSDTLFVLSINSVFAVRIL